ncbi:hypothetical protein ATOBIA_N03390 [Atopobiaceae bacterium P1]|nr:hypothetical protein ATOBIA_N03390 [Atopobiaceae bacterium P1]
MVSKKALKVPSSMTWAAAGVPMAALAALATIPSYQDWRDKDCAKSTSKSVSKSIVIIFRNIR